MSDFSKVRSALYRLADSGTWDGRAVTNYFERCRGSIQIYPDLSARVMFTRDVGYHTSGWWKNPDYERCYHLSLSFFVPETGEAVQRNESWTLDLLRALFGGHHRKLWCEPPFSDDGKRRGVWHYRLFCDSHWQPIKPRGEVYSRELTEAGWKSFSDVQAEMNAIMELERSKVE